MDSLISAMLFDVTRVDIAETQAIWVGVYLSIHILWDIFSNETPDFQFRMLKDKVETFFAAATFASGMGFAVAIFNPEVAKSVSHSKSAIFLAAGVCLLYGLAEFSPVKNKP